MTNRTPPNPIPDQRAHPTTAPEVHPACHPAADLPGQVTQPAPTPVTVPAAEGACEPAGPTREGPANTTVIHGRLQPRYANKHQTDDGLWNLLPSDCT